MQLLMSRYSAFGRKAAALQETGGVQDGSQERGGKGNGETDSRRRKERCEARGKERGRGREGERELGLGFE